MESTPEEPYHEMKRRLPILWTVMNYLPVRELLKARHIDHYWKEAIDDLLHHQEGNGESPLEAITLFSRPQTFQHFQAAFPAPNPQNGFRLFYIGKLKLNLGGTPFPELQQMVNVYSRHLTFVTIGVPTSTGKVLKYLKVVLNNCGVLQKLSLVSDWSESPGIETLPDISAPVVLGRLPRLERIDLVNLSSISTGMGEFLQEVVNSAPNLRWTYVNFQNTPASPIPGMIRPLQHTLLVKFDFQLMTSDHLQILNQLVEMNLKVRELGLYVFRTDEGDGILTLIPEWLSQLNNNGLQKLSLKSVESLHLRLPPLLNIRSLVVNAKLENPIESGQVPELDEVMLQRSYPQNHSLLVQDPNSFAPGEAFPTVKKLRIYLQHGCRNTQLEFGFPNLESLELTDVSPKIGLEDVPTMRKLLQFPNLVRLVVDFRRTWNYQDIVEETWWDLFTGGILPTMNHKTKLEVIFAKGLLIGRVDQEGNVKPSTPCPSLFELLPNLRRLELWNCCPELVAFAIIHLTATESIPRLETLRFDHIQGYLPLLDRVPDLKYFVPMLKDYHHSVVLI